MSHVLNDVEGARVAEETRQRVRKVSQQLGYTPSRLARSLRMQRTQTIGMISDRILTTPHAGKTILGAQETALSRGYSLLLSNTGAVPGVEEQAVQTLAQFQVEGILYATMYHQIVRPPAALRARPTVLLDAWSSDGAFPGIVPDESEGGRTAVAELIRYGHTRIGFVTNVDDIPATRGRLAGYRAGLKDAGVRYDARLVVAEESESRGGYAAARELLSRPNRPTALFCFNDRMAMGAYRAAAELGLQVPHDVSVVGFDDQEYLADGLFPGLTTMALPHYEMGRWAATTLLDGIVAGDLWTARPYRPTLIECPIVRRDSVAAPRAD